VTENYKYWAFISYSHRDRAWGDWLHKTLETYRVPRRLIGRPSRDGQVPERLFPVFRDRDELPSSANLGDVLNESLRQSRYQIVICSPRSAASKWVNEEIKYFKSLGREDRVLCLIVDGEPNVFDIPGRDIEECFAPALRYRVDANGQVTDTPAEPIAADAREHADGKRGAKLKLLSGLLGVGLDEIVQRERQREFWKRVQIGAAAMAFAGLCVGAWQWFQSERAAREREIVIEKLVESGRLELLAGQHARAAVFLNEAYKMGHDTVPLRFMLAQAMKPVEALTDVRVEHGGAAVYASAFSADGRRFALHVLQQAVGQQHAVIKIYDATDGSLLHELPDAPALPLHIEFLGDGEHVLATGFPDDIRSGAPFTRLWSLRDAVVALHIDGINGYAGQPASPDGSRVLVADERGLHIHDTQIGTQVAHWLPGQPLRAAAYSQDGARIAVATADGVVKTIDAQDGRLLQRYAEANGEPLAALMFSPTGRDLIGLPGRSDLRQLNGDIRVWNTADGALRLSFAADSGLLYKLHFSSDGRRFSTVGGEGYKVWSAGRGILQFSTSRPLTAYATAALSPDGNTLITADFQNRVAEAWDVLSKRLLHTLDLHTDGVSSAAFNSDGNRLLLASRDGSASLWRMPADGGWRYESFETLPYVSRFTADGRRLLVGGGRAGDGHAMVLNTQTGVIETRFEGHDDVVVDVDLDPGESRLITASFDGTAALWRYPQGVRAATLQQSPEGTYTARFNRDGSRILTTTSPTGSVPDIDAAGLWNSISGKQLARLSHTKFVYAASFDRKGVRAATAAFDGTLKIWRAVDGQLLRSWPPAGEKLLALAFSPDDSELAVASKGGIQLLDPNNGAQIGYLRDEGLGLPEVLAYAPNGEQLAIGTQSGEIWLWTAKHKVVRSLKGHRQLVDRLAYSGDSSLLFSSGLDGEVRVWDAHAGAALGVLLSFPRKVSYDLHPSTGQLVATSWSQISLIDVNPEGRDSGAVGRVLACKAPWVLADNLKLVPASRRSDQCSAAPS
jgi:WD40 repeat protein